MSVDGKVQLDPERSTNPLTERIAVDGIDIEQQRRRYLALNKPRGVVVSAADERGRDTVYDLMKAAKLPWLAPVGRLDKASEGLLLLSNDPQWAARITDPERHIPKTYHVQVAGLPSDGTLQAMLRGVEDRGDHLSVSAVSILRQGEKNAWLEIVLEEGRNRHIRRLIAALGHDVLRLVRVAIGPLALGDLPKGAWRELDQEELQALERLAR